MAMKIGGKYEPEKLFMRHWHRLVPDTAVARKNLEKTLSDMSETVLSEAEKLKIDLKKDGITSPVFDSIIAVIKKRAKSITA